MSYLNTGSVFLILVLVQGLHSIEEYVGRLWEVFPPAQALTAAVSDDLEEGFLIINIGLFIFGLLCWLLFVRKSHSFSPVLIWFWVILEVANGIVHPGWALITWAYTPGLITAPILFLMAARLIRLQFKK